MTFVDAGNNEVPVRSLGGRLVWFDANGNLFRAEDGGPILEIEAIFYSGAGCTGNVGIIFATTPMIGATFPWVSAETRAVSPGAAPQNMTYVSVRYGGNGALCENQAGNAGSLVMLTNTATVQQPNVSSGFLRPEMQ